MPVVVTLFREVSEVLGQAPRLLATRECRAELSSLKPSAAGFGSPGLSARPDSQSRSLCPVQ